MQRHLHTKGIILRKMKQDEHDELITLYSPEFGKINALAKGGRKITSHFCGHLETLNICQFELYKSSYRFTITQAVISKSFKNIRNSFRSTMDALMALEIFQKTTSNEESFGGEKLFQLLEKTLEQLERSQASLLIIESFKLRLMQNLGVLPDITVCSVCEKRWDQHDLISLSEDNHLICHRCQPQFSLPHKQRIDFKIIKLINFLLENDVLKSKLILNKEDTEKLTFFTNIFLYNYVNKEIYSQKIIDQIGC